jgi:hypothetical protein
MRGALLLLAWLPLAAADVVKGRVTDGRAPLGGVRVSFDWGPRVNPMAAREAVRTDVDGHFVLPCPTAFPPRLAVEKEGWYRDLVPESEWGGDIVLHKASRVLKAPVLVVRVDLPGHESTVDDETLRRLFFGRAPGEASAAAYLAEASKGMLSLEEGAILHLTCPFDLGPEPDESRDHLAEWVLKQLKGLDLRSFDKVNNATGAPVPDGKPDHLWVVIPGAPRSVTTRPEDFKPTCLLQPLPWAKHKRWAMLLLPDEVVLGNVVHESLHAMGEHRVDDFYLDCDHPMTAGIWDVMDVGMYRGWDRHHPSEGPWREDTAYSPSQPMGWTRAELWYRGAFRATVPTVRMAKGAWEGWLDPLERAPGAFPQRIVVPDPRRKGGFFEFSVRRPWGYDAGSVGGRKTVGMEGLVVARIDPAMLSRDEPRGPVHVIDAHPGTQEPQAPRFPCDRFELDDAAFNVGPGEVAKGQEGSLRWEVLDADASGRLKVRVAFHRRR